MKIRHLPRATSAEEIAAALAEDGAAIVDRLVGPEVLDRAQRELDPFIIFPRRTSADWLAELSDADILATEVVDYRAVL